MAATLSPSVPGVHKTGFQATVRSAAGGILIEMSLYRQQAQIDAPVEAVWELLGDANRHEEWWPRVVEVQCDGDLTEGCTYRMVAKGPAGDQEMRVGVERLEDCHEILIRCVDTGTYCRWLLTEAQGGTFIDAEFGMDPKAIGPRIWDVFAGRRYFRRWLEQSLQALEACADSSAEAA
jgi:hypothetical protein